MWFRVSATEEVPYVNITHVDENGEYYVWQDTNPLVDWWYISTYDNIGFPLKVDGYITYKQTKFAVNGRESYTNGILYIWYTGTSWVISAGIGYDNAGYALVDFDGNPTGTIIGFDYWECADLIGEYEAKGTATGGSKVVEWASNVTGYEADGEGQLGSYTLIGGEDKKYLGWEYFAYSPDGGGSIIFIQELNQYNSKRCYKCSDEGLSLWWDETNWIISQGKGVKNDNIGYWECASLDGPFVLVVDEEVEPVPTPSQYIYADSGYTLDVTKKQRIYIAQIAMWYDTIDQE